MFALNNSQSTHVGNLRYKFRLSIPKTSRNGALPALAATYQWRQVSAITVLYNFWILLCVQQYIKLIS